MPTEENFDDSILLALFLLLAEVDHSLDNNDRLLLLLAIDETCEDSLEESAISNKDRILDSTEEILQTMCNDDKARRVFERTSMADRAVSTGLELPGAPEIRPRT